jgi:hypothetical protein
MMSRAIKFGATALHICVPCQKHTPVLVLPVSNTYNSLVAIQLRVCQDEDLTIQLAS